MKQKFILMLFLCGHYGVSHAYVEKNCSNDHGNYFITRFDTNCDNVVYKDEFLSSAAERFKHMDVNGDQAITLPEFLQRYADFQSVKKLAENSKTPEPSKIFAKLDANGDQKITEQEYIESRKKWFSDLDKNKDDRVTVEESGQ